MHWARVLKFLSFKSLLAFFEHFLCIFGLILAILRVETAKYSHENSINESSLRCPFEINKKLYLTISIKLYAELL